MAKARHDGANYIYSLLSGYSTPPAGLKMDDAAVAGKVWEAERLPDAEIRSLTELPGLLAGWNKTRA